MAVINTFNDVVPIAVAALDEVAQEMVGAIAGVRRDAKTDQIKKGQTLNVPLVPDATEEDITPAMAIPETGAQTTDTVSVAMTNFKAYPFTLTGEEDAALGIEVADGIIKNSIAQAMRKSVNSMEAYLLTKLYKGASRATGTAGTTPFASNYNTILELQKILDDNGAPGTNDPSLRTLVIDTAAALKLGQLSSLAQVNTAGSDALLRNGVLLPISGFSIRKSAGVQYHTAGAASGQLINNASGEAVGQTTLTLDTITVNTTGIKAGDVITHASDSANKYVVKTGLVATAGDIVINKPGLLVAAANNDAVSIGSSYRANVAFARSAAVLCTRIPFRPRVGDKSVDIKLLTDPRTGITWALALYQGYHSARWQLEIAYDAAVIKPEFIATLMG